MCFTSYTGSSLQGRFGGAHPAEGRIGRRWTCYQLRKKKTFAMLIPPNPRLTASFVNCTIKCGDTDLKFVHQTRLLGIIVDSAPSWSVQVDNDCRKVGRKIGALRRSFRELTQYPRMRRKFLLSVIQPDLEHTAFVYVPLMSVGLRNRFEAIWRRAVRCAAGAGFSMRFLHYWKKWS